MEPIDKEKFGAFIAELRKEKGLTQQELAERLFITNKAVSKWERGQSFPDVGLLNPLADNLGVTVAELLRGERLTEDTVDICEAENLVKTTIRLSEEEQEKRRTQKAFWRKAWLICTIVAALESTALIALNRLNAVELWDFLLLVEGLSLMISGYFCFFAKEVLPAFYDENKLNFYSDGIFRMNLPGVRFSNSNWPHILHVGRTWPLGAAVLWPPVFWVCRRLLSDRGMLPLTLVFSLSFFIPMVWAAKKYE